MGSLLVCSVYRDVEVRVLVHITEYETGFDDQFLGLESCLLALSHHRALTCRDKDPVLVGFQTLLDDTVNNIGNR